MSGSNRLGFIFLIALVFCGLSAQAKISVIRVLGSSSYEIPNEDNANLLIFGGTAGVSCTGATDRDTCNNCGSVGPLQKCNANRIYPNLWLRIEFQSDAKRGRPIFVDNDGNSFGVSGPMTERNATGYVEARWSDICPKLEPSSANCEGQAVRTLRIGFDENNNGSLDSGEDSLSVVLRIYDPGDSSTDFDTNKGCTANDPKANAGICDYIAAAGDAKIYIDSPEQGQGPTIIPFQSLRVLISDKDFPCSLNEGLEYSDLTISGTSEGGFSLDSKIVDRLSNGTLYYLRIATVDKAGNINNFMDDSVINSACGTAYSCSGSRNLAGLSLSCPYTARPDEVLGLLTEDFNCFIATASYGSPFDARLDMLRAFRSQILNQFDWGKSFIRTYYKKGPYAARWVADHPWSRPILQILLWPLWVFAWISVKWGLSTALILCFAGLFLPFALYSLAKRWPTRQEEKAFE